ncbi:MAG: LemA family protein [Bacillota bacterium]|nr:LemA family protein [Bacillota bacterium]
MVYAVIFVAFLIVLYWIVTFNSLIKFRNWVNEAWAQIDVQLKRRYDLIPNLIETVKGYMKYEQETLEKVVQARNSLMNGSSRSNQIEANDLLSGTLKSLFALSEGYPDLKANRSFVQLQEELSGTENKIAYSRQLYNNTVMKYNTKIQSFPSNLIAVVHGFKAEQMLETKSEERENVRVSF